LPEKEGRKAAAAEWLLHVVREWKTGSGVCVSVGREADISQPPDKTTANLAGTRSVSGGSSTSGGGGGHGEDTRRRRPLRRKRARRQDSLRSNPDDAPTSEDRSEDMSGSETGSEQDHQGGGARGGGENRGGGGGRGGGGDLASRSLVLENKRFYLDVKENTRGRFIKMAEISPDGRKNQILMTLPTAAAFRQHLVSMIQYYAELEAVDPERLTQGELRSEVMFKDDKKYHVDLKENARGRFLKVSETFTRGYSRFQIFIPAEGMEEFNQHLQELIEQYDVDGEVEQAASGPQLKHVKIENKNFYFECKKNAKGRYITISEVKGNFKNTILVPESGWDEFRDVFDEYTRQCKE